MRIQRQEKIPGVTSISYYIIVNQEDFIYSKLLNILNHILRRPSTVWITQNLGGRAKLVFHGAASPCLDRKVNFEILSDLAGTRGLRGHETDSRKVDGTPTGNLFEMFMNDSNFNIGGR